MKKRNLIFIIVGLVLIVGILTTILIVRGSIWQKEKVSDEFKQAQATFDIRLNSDHTEYYIYRLKSGANTGWGHNYYSRILLMGYLLLD